MQDRRKEPRHPLKAYAQVFDLYGGYLLGYLADLHLQGAMIIGSNPLDINKEFTLAIELPPLPLIKAARMTIQARVAWCEKDISPEFFNIGFEFEELTADHTNVIKAIMENYEFNRSSPPSYPARPR